MDTFVLLAGRYADEASATADYDAVKDLYGRLGLDATFDAAVMTRDENGAAPSAGSPSASPVGPSWRCSRPSPSPAA